MRRWGPYPGPSDFQTWFVQSMSIQRWHFKGRDEVVATTKKKPLKCSHCIVCFPLLEIVAEQSPRPLAKLLESLAVTWTSYRELCLYILRRGLTFCTKTEPTAAERTRQNVDNRKPCVVRVYVHLQSARCLFIYFHIRPSSA